MVSYGRTRVIICQDSADLGKVSAADVAEKLRELLAVKPLVRVVFAAGESQSSFLDALSIAPGLDWQRVECFNIDDFWDRRMPREYTCGAQTTRQLYDKVCPYRVELVRYNAPEAETEAKRFEKLLRERSLDIVCQGIGTSGHLALNEPEDTDFNDPAWVRVTDVVEQSKRQLKEDPNFKSLGYIPEKGITMTIPAILSASHIFTMVPLRLKREILTRLAEELEPTVSLPASILRAKGSLLYVDRDSCPRCWV